MLLNPPARPASDLSPTAGLSFWSSGCVRSFPVGTKSRFAIARYRGAVFGRFHERAPIPRGGGVSSEHQGGIRDEAAASGHTCCSAI